MNLDCKIIEDLLPLYLDQVCHDQTKKVVEKHLKECKSCSTLVSQTQAIQIPHSEFENPASDTIVIKGFKKIRRRWIASLISIFMLLPITCIGFLSYHEIQQEGICFSNLDDIYRCYKFLHYIENGKFQQVSEMIDFSKRDYQLVESVADMSPEEYQVYMEERLYQKLQEYESLGLSIDNIHYEYSYYCENSWTICLSFNEHYPDGSQKKILAHMNGNTLDAGAFSYPNETLIERDDYIDEILVLYSEDMSTFYEDFEVIFELKEGEKAIVRRTGNSPIEPHGIFNLTYGTGTSLTEEPYYQDTFETSVPGKYAITYFSEDGETKFLKTEDVDIEIIKY